MVGATNVFHETVSFVFAYTLVQHYLVFSLGSSKVPSWFLLPYKIIHIIQHLLSLNNILSNKQVVYTTSKSAINILG